MLNIDKKILNTAKKILNLLDKLDAKLNVYKLYYVSFNHLWGYIKVTRKIKEFSS